MLRAIVNYGRQINLKRWLIVASIILILPLLLYTGLLLLRPPRTNLEMTLFQGIAYQRQARSNPRPYMLHIVTIDLTAPGIKVLVTPGLLNPDNGETLAKTTSEFVRQFQLQLAVNANYFFPFRERSPWDFYPHSGDRIYIVGQAISRGFTYSGAESKWPVLCFDLNNRARIFASGNCPDRTVNAVAGKPILLTRGAVVNLDSFYNDKPYARLAVAIDSKGEKLWLIVVDGKQPLYSEGVTLAELSEIVKELGAFEALNLDGGGSTTLVVANNSNIQLLNAPIHTKIPIRQRPVANHLGFYALQIDP